MIRTRLLKRNRNFINWLHTTCQDKTRYILFLELSDVFRIQYDLMLSYSIFYNIDWFMRDVITLVVGKELRRCDDRTVC